MQTDIQKFREITDKALENDLGQDWLVVFNTMKEVLDECDDSESIDEFFMLLDVKLEEKREAEIKEQREKEERQDKEKNRNTLMVTLLLIAALLLLNLLS